MDMNSDVRLSIIIPVYNAAEYIGECLESIFLQNGAVSFEVICINDASTDDSAEIIKAYQRKYCNITLHSHDANLGVSAARNRGLDIANGDYVWFVDSDDLLRNRALKTISGEIDVSFCDIICFNAHCFTKNSQYSFLEDDYRRSLKTIDVAHEWYAPFFLISNTWLCCLRKDFVRGCGVRFDEDFTFGEDWLFLWMLAAHAPKVKYLDLFLYKYRGGTMKNLMSVFYDSESYDAFFVVAEKTRAFLCEMGVFDEVERFFTIRANDILCFYFFAKRFRSYASYSRCCDQYSAFLNSVHPYLLAEAIKRHSKTTRFILEKLKRNSRFYTTLLYSVDNFRIKSILAKLKKHTLRLARPVACSLLWLSEPPRIVFYWLKFSWRIFLACCDFLKHIIFR